MPTVKEKIVADLKNLGYNSRKVSVRRRHSCAYDITIRDASVNYQAVKEIANRHERIDRCPHTFEILSGGNTYIDLDVTVEVENIWADKYLWILEEAVPTAVSDTIRIGRFLIGFYDEHTLKIYDREKDGHFPMRYSKTDLKGIAVDFFIAEQN